MSMRCVWLLSLTLIAGLAADVRLRAQEPAETFEEAEVATAPVVLDGAVLLRVRGVSSFPAPARARQIGVQIAKVASDRTIPPDSLRIVEEDGLTRLVAGSLPIMTVAEGDASLEQVRLLELAETHRRRIRQAIVDYRAARSGDALRRGAGRFVAAIRGVR